MFKKCKLLISKEKISRKTKSRDAAREQFSCFCVKNHWAVIFNINYCGAAMLDYVANPLIVGYTPCGLSPQHNVH